MLVVPLLRSGLHCGPNGEVTGRRWRDVVPLLRSGLHCGAKGYGVISGANAGRPAPPERAPLRPGVLVVVGGQQRRRRPAPPERAPLRHGVRRKEGAPRRQSSRSSGAGSIAASARPARSAATRPSSRSSGAGSIAAFGPRITCIRPTSVVPLLRSGLRCGPSPSSSGRTARSSSRSAGAGSIAAQRPVRCGEVQPGRRAPPERAPLRQLRRRRPVKFRPDRPAPPGAGPIAAGASAWLLTRQRRAWLL